MFFDIKHVMRPTQARFKVFYTRQYVAYCSSVSQNQEMHQLQHGSQQFKLILSPTNIVTLLCDILSSSAGIKNEWSRTSTPLHVVLENRRLQIYLNLYIFI